MLERLFTHPDDWSEDDGAVINLLRVVIFWAIIWFLLWLLAS